MSDVSQARPTPGVPRPIGYALWHLDEARAWTLGYVEDITQESLDLTAPGHRHSVSTLLYHIAVFEADWVYTDVLGNPYDMERRIPGCPPHVAAVFPHPMLLEHHVYTPVEGEPIETHLERLAVMRDALVDVYRVMDLDAFRSARPGGDGEVTAEWVLMHLARHESEHRGQIWEARLAAEDILEAR
jgi:hypothetical protein